MRKAYCLVRAGRSDLEDAHGRFWQPIVHRCPMPGYMSYRVCLHGDAVTVLVEHFDVHTGRYANDQEETRVSLSAAGSACEVAAHLETLEPWRLRTHTRSAYP